MLVDLMLFDVMILDSIVVDVIVADVMLVVAVLVDIMLVDFLYTDISKQVGLFFSYRRSCVQSEAVEVTFCLTEYVVLCLGRGAVPHMDDALGGQLVDEVE